MRTAFAFLSLLVVTPVFAAGTAYEAMRVVGKQKGEASLEKVVEVRGEVGAPQPTQWKITVIDDKKKGLREFEVKEVKIIGDRVGKGGFAAPINLNQLNLDSDGAHTVADREAKKVAFTYDNVSYVLRSADTSPVWDLRLTDSRAHTLATLQISADTGNVISSEGFTKNPEPVPAPVATQPEPGPDRPPGDNGVVGNKVVNFIDRVGRHMDRRMHQVKDGLHNTFTGENRNTAPPRPGEASPASRTGPQPATEPPHADLTAERPKD